MAEQIVLLGVDYHRAPVEVREELSFTPDQARAVLPQLVDRTGAREALVLATCNRTEFYLAYEGESPEAGVLQILRALRSQARALHQDCLRFTASGEDAARHLFGVAAGIDSQILGDTNIVTQVKHAHRLAQDAGTLGPMLDRTVTESLRAAKRARRETALGRGAASVGAAVLRSLRAVYGDLEQVRALVLGGGEACRDIARQLGKVGLADLSFAARNPAQSAAMAREFQGSVTAWDQVRDRIAVVDVLITATAARLSVCERSALEQATEQRNRPLLIVDAGIPRNVDPAASELPHIRLLNLDGLGHEQELTLAARRREIPRVELILDQELDRWRRWKERRAERTAAGGWNACSPLTHRSLEGG